MSRQPEAAEGMPTGARGAAASASVTLRFANPDEAQAAAKALAPDNGEHLRTRVEGADLHLEATSGSAMGLLRTLDDALACLRATGLP